MKMGIAHYSPGVGPILDIMRDGPYCMDIGHFQAEIMFASDSEIEK